MHVRLFLLVMLLAFTSAQAGTQSEVGNIHDPRIDEAIALMNNFALGFSDYDVSE